MTVEFYEMRPTDGLFPSQVRASSLKPFQFPGGEWSVKVDRPITGTGITGREQVAYITDATPDDMFALAMWVDYIRRSPHRDLQLTLLMPYIPAARADRGTPLGAKVYADFINNLHLDEVVVADPHSDVAPALYDNLTIVHLEDLSFWKRVTDNTEGMWDGVVIPDLGAVKRSTAVAEKLGLPAYQATKHRDFRTGKLSGFSIDQALPDGRYLLVDDICDGGGTFLGLADVLLDTTNDVTLDLWVTHGIFSNGAVDKLLTKFDQIYTTSSRDEADLAENEHYEDERINVHPLFADLLNASHIRTYRFI